MNIVLKVLRRVEVCFHIGSSSQGYGCLQKTGLFYNKGVGIYTGPL